MQGRTSHTTLDDVLSQHLQTAFQLIKIFILREDEAYSDFSE